MYWYFDAWRQYAVFNGRSSRAAFWQFFLINLLVSAALIFMEITIDIYGVLDAIYSLASFLPFIALTVRRLHDTNRSGWWLLAFLLPPIGTLILFLFLVLPSDEGTNRYDFPLSLTDFY